MSNAQARPKPQAIFEFHSGFWVNLHQFLYQEATTLNPMQTDSPEWQAAVEYYRREIVPKGEMSLHLTAVNNRLSEAGSETELPTGLDPALAAALSKSSPVYRRVWWPQHDRSNLAWVDAVLPLLAKYGAAMQKEMSDAYGVQWPARSVRTDVSVYAGPNGAYTTTTPTPHITVSSIDTSYQGNASLEMLFHEISHALDENLRAVLARELASSGRLFRRRAFDHAIIFYTAGEVTRHYLAGYEPYALRNGVWQSGWPGGLEVLEKDWKPYLEGRTDMAKAVRAIIADYGVPKNAP